jgi:hypothetical protein
VSEPHGHPAAGEPQATIYKAPWREARQRLEAVVPDDVRGLLALAMDHVEAGWSAVRALQLWAEQNPERDRPEDGYGRVLTFGEAEVRESFCRIARGLAELVTSWPACEPPNTAEEINDQLDEFVRYATVLALAAESANTPTEHRLRVRQVEQLLDNWAPELADILGIVDGLFIASTARNALDILVHDIPDADQHRVRGLLAGEVLSFYSRTGRPLPPWLELLQSYFAPHGREHQA